MMEKSSRIPLLIDTDPGVDDALAILMALASPHHRLLGLSVSAGNVGLAHTVRNALKLCEVAGRADIPVFVGSEKPLLHPAPDAADVHGSDGFGDIGFAPPQHGPADEHAALAIARLARLHSGQLLLVALGPLTNLALALRLDPQLPRHVGRLVVMSGAVNGRGNITPYAEFNSYFDPEAAHIVFEAFEQIDVVDWEATMAHGFAHDDLAHWCTANTPQARFYDAISAKTRQWARHRHADLWHSADALAMAYALAPDAPGVDVACHRLEVALQAATRGMTLVDWQNLAGRPANARILLRYPQAEFNACLAETLSATLTDKRG